MPNLIRVAGFEVDQDDTTLTLMVARKRGDGVEGGMVNVASGALNAFRELAWTEMARLEELEERNYDPDAHLEQGQYFSMARSDVEDSLGVLQLLELGPDAPLWAVEDLPDRPLLFYALVTGSRPAARTAFVAKSNPARTAHRGLPMTPSRGSLTTIATPVFIFDERVDLIVDSTHIVALNQLAFEQWFRDTPALLLRLDDWVANISRRLPISGNGRRQLAERCRTNSRLRRVLYSIEQRGHLANVTLEQVRGHVRAQGLEEAELIRNNELVFDQADPTTLLKLLNEDLFLGGLTGDPFVVDRKALRTR